MCLELNFAIIKWPCFFDLGEIHDSAAPIFNVLVCVYGVVGGPEGLFVPTTNVSIATVVAIAFWLEDIQRLLFFEVSQHEFPHILM